MSSSTSSGCTLSSSSSSCTGRLRHKCTWQRPLYSAECVEEEFSEVPSVSNRWPENQSETPSASCMGKSWHPQTDLIIVWSHCGVGGCSEGRGPTYHPPRLHAQGPRELLDRSCEDRDSVK